VRATGFSLDGHVTALAAIVGGPLIGAAATGYGTRRALGFAAIVLVPARLLYACSTRRDAPSAAPAGQERRLD
jgi:hypothetical protein